MRILNSYREHTSNILKKFSKTNTKLAIKSNQRIFILRCRKKKLLPQHLNFHVTNSIVFANDTVSYMCSSLSENFKFRLLRFEIRDICITIHRLRKDIYSIERKIIKILPPVTYHRFFDSESIKAQKIFITYKNNCKSKFQSHQQKPYYDKK